MLLTAFITYTMITGTKSPSSGQYHALLNRTPPVPTVPNLEIIIMQIAFFSYQRLFFRFG